MIHRYTLIIEICLGCGRAFRLIFVFFRVSLPVVGARREKTPTLKGDVVTACDD
jgi:hypothetical protein